MSAVAANSIQFHSGASGGAQPVTHSALDFFEEPLTLKIYEGSHDQGLFHKWGARTTT